MPTAVPPLSVAAPIGARVRPPPRRQDVIYQAVGAGVLGAEDEVPVRVGPDDPEPVTEGSYLLEPADVFAALADPTRRQILRRLSSDGPLSATELAGGFAVSRQAVVKHLSTLTSAGMFRSDGQGREVRYGLVPDRLHDATTWLDEVGRLWDRRLEALLDRFPPGPGLQLA